MGVLGREATARARGHPFIGLSPEAERAAGAWIAAKWARWGSTGAGAGRRSATKNGTPPGS
jgi:hypothetical protein